MNDIDRQKIIDVVDHYNQCFYDKDIDALRQMYVSDGVVPFFDNHAGCDTQSVDDHLNLVAVFFASGHIVTLLKENIHVFSSKQTACITLTLRYSNQPTPGIRTTMYLELENSAWKIRHIHHSTNPNEDK